MNTEYMLTLTCCQDHILTENIWFVWSQTSYSGDKWTSYECGTDDKQTNKQTTSKDKATQLLICISLRLAILLFWALIRSRLIVFFNRLFGNDESTCPFFDGLPVVPAKKNASGPWHCNDYHLSQFHSMFYLAVVCEVLNQDRLVIEGKHISTNVVPDVHKRANFSFA